MKLQRVIEYSFYALLIIVPLILTPWNYELFEFNKMLAVYVLTVIITAAWAIRMIITKKWLIARTPFDIPILLFLASQILATIFSIDIRTSLLGYYSRFHGGLLSTISYILLYYAFVSNLTTRHALRAIGYMLFAAALVAAYGIAEHFGIDKNLWVQDVQNRVFSTLGQPNWLAAYLVTIIFIPIAFTLKNHKLYAIGYLLFAIYYLTLLYTKSRSGLLGFAVAYLLFWSLTLVRSILARVAFPWKRFLILNFALLILTFFDGLRWIPIVSKYTSEVKSSNTSEVKPIAGTQLESGGSESGDIRKIVWKGALKIWRRYPLFGSGVETFAYSYYNFRPAEHNLVSEWDFLYNKAHNEYLNFLATTGIVGLGSYLLLQIWFVVWILKKLANGKWQMANGPNYTLYAIRYTLIALLAGFAGLSTSNFFGFSTVPVALLFWLYPAFAVVLTRHET